MKLETSSVQPAKQDELWQTLVTLFPSHPSAHLRLHGLVDSENGKKIITVGRPATAREYREHLAPTARRGPGALGIFPSQMLGDIRTGQRLWFSSILCLDLDETHPNHLGPFLDTLLGNDIYAYPTRGTTGRGSHVWIFLEQLLPLEQGYEVVGKLAVFAREAGYERVEYRPSSPSGRGQGILLPYRGASTDRFGFNPLLDPERELAPIPLTESLGKHGIKKTPVDVLLDFTRKIARRTPPAPPELPRPTTSTVAPGLLDAEKAWGAELQRVAPDWKRGNRQHLAMALAGFGLVGLGLPVDVVTEGIDRLAASCGDDDLPRRRRAVQNTYERLLQGRRVAWIPFYQRAGVEPPQHTGVPAIVMEKLRLIERRLAILSWKGTSSLNNSSVYIALYKVATAHGQDHEQGVAVTIDIRSLALHAGVSDQTAKTALKRLTKAHLVMRLHRRRQATEAGTLVLLTPHEEANLAHSSTNNLIITAWQKEWVKLCTHPAFRHGKLSKKASVVLAVLVTSDGPLALTGIGKVLEEPARNLRTPVARLEQHGIIVREGSDGYRPSDDWRHALETAAHTTGAIHTEQRQRERHEQERAAYREHLGIR